MPESHGKRRRNSAWVALLLVLLLASAAFGLAYRLCWLGRVSVEPPGVGPGPAPVPGLPVAVVRSERTAQFLGSPKDYDAHPEYWKGLVQRLGGRVETISDPGLEGDLGPYKVLVLPSTVCLSEAGKAGVRAFLAGGGGVVATWATGTRDQSGAWKSWDFLREITGADAFEVREAPAPWLVSFRSGNPVAAGALAGTRIQVASPERLEAAALEVDAHWSDARLHPRDPALPGNVQGAILHRDARPGRVVWFGFQENSAVAGGDDKRLLDAALANAVAWAGGRVRVDLEAWPFPFTAAAVVALDVDESPQNLSYAVDALLRAGARGTVFCPTDRIEESREALGLERAGEVAWRTGALADEPGMPARFGRIVSARVKLRRGLGAWAVGLHPPRNETDPRVLAVLAGSGFRYYLIDGESPSVRPEILRFSQSFAGRERGLELVRITRMADDDLHLSPLGLLGLDPEWVVRRVLSDFDVVRGLGGLYVLSCHTQGLAAAEYASVLPKLIAEWKGRWTWVAAAGEVANWWLARSRLALAVAPQGEKGLRVTVASAARVPLDGVAIGLYPPPGTQEVRLAAAEPKTPVPRVVAEGPGGRVRLVLGRLEPGQTYLYELRLEH